MTEPKSPAICRDIETPAGILVGQIVFCPGCREVHVYDSRWVFNGDYNKPTFKPSYRARRGKDLQWVCHSFVTEGKIQFLNDCSHDLKGQTIDLTSIDEGRSGRKP